jgi:hypothetical protein
LGFGGHSAGKLNTNANRVEEFLHRRAISRTWFRAAPRKIERSNFLEKHFGVAILGYTLPKCGKLCIFAGNNLI